MVILTAMALSLQCYALARYVRERARKRGIHQRSACGHEYAHKWPVPRVVSVSLVPGKIKRASVIADTHGQCAHVLIGDNLTTRQIAIHNSDGIRYLRRRLKGHHGNWIGGANEAAERVEMRRCSLWVWQLGTYS